MSHFKSLIFLLLVVSANSYASDCKDPSQIEKAAMGAAGNVVLGANASTGLPLQYDWLTEDGNDLWTVYVQSNDAGQCQSAYFVKTKFNDCGTVIGKPINVNSMNKNFKLGMEPNCS